jgi:hypothetical protein
MNKKSLKWLVIFGLVVMVAISVMAAIAAMNTVPISRASNQSFPISLNDTKPTECAGISLTNKIICPSTGTCNGTSGNDLMYANSGNPTINGTQGNDCLVCHSGGSCTLNGGPGTDVCICKNGSCNFGSCETQFTY